MNDKFTEDEALQLNELDIEDTEDAVESDVTAKIDDDGRTEIVGVRFKKNGKTYYFAPNGFNLNTDDRVIVDTSRGQEYGYTAVGNREIKNSEICEPLRAVIRMATDEDTRIHEENVKKEIDAFNACIVLIDKHKLEMKLIDAELSFDRSKLIFYFSAEGRVDFRELVKDLASAFHTRIEMRQIGIRDEAKILGGLGICGRPYCCNTFLTDFGQVSVKMAKEQNLSLNSAKISGSCGRLMCCLRYEYDTYLKEKALTPKLDARVVTPNGPGIVVAANPLAGIVKVHLDSSTDEAESVMFVREDVVEESKYEGQPLTKTEIPDKKHKENELPPVFGGTLNDMPKSTPANDVSAPEKDEAQPISSAPTVNKTENQEPSQADNSHKKNHRHRHKKHVGNRENQQKQNENSQNQEQQRNQQADKGSQKPQKHHPHKHNNQAPAQKDNQPANNNTQSNPQENAFANPNKKKKKFFKPYYKHGKNNKKPDTGDNK